jgi:hypothetical protein
VSSEIGRFMRHNERRKRKCQVGVYVVDARILKAFKSHLQTMCALCSSQRIRYVPGKAAFDCRAASLASKKTKRKQPFFARTQNGAPWISTWRSNHALTWWLGTIGIEIEVEEGEFLYILPVLYTKLAHLLWIGEPYLTS